VACLGQFSQLSQRVFCRLDHDGKSAFLDLGVYQYGMSPLGRRELINWSTNQ
jgi:hypothetical protein